MRDGEVDDKSLTLEILLKVKDDVATTGASVARIEGQIMRLPCGSHLQEITNLRADVATIKEKDLPELRQHFAVLDWFRKGRNKAIAAALALLLGLGGTIIGELLLSRLLPTSNAAPSAQTSGERPETP